MILTNLRNGFSIALLTAFMAVMDILSLGYGRVLGSRVWLSILMLIGSLLLILHWALQRHGRIRRASRLILVLMFYFLSVLTYGLGMTLWRMREAPAVSSLLPCLITTCTIFDIFEIRPLYSVPMMLFDTIVLLTGEIRYGQMHRDMESVSLLVLLAVILYASVVHYGLYYRELRARITIREQNEKLRRLSEKDELTGLGNRLGLRDHFSSFTRQNVIILMMDVDHFKHYNDTYGHDAGDEILRQIGASVQKYFGMGRCYRYGGDEILVFSEMDVESFLLTLERLRQEMGRIRIGSMNERITGSFGYCYGYAQDEAVLRDMRIQADQYLYRAKDSGRNTAVGYPLDRNRAEGLDAAWEAARDREAREAGDEYRTAGRVTDQ